LHIDNTLFVGKVLHHFDRLPSTNDFTLELLSKGEVAEGTVVSTDDQYRGRGQMGNNWESHAGQNVTMSVLVKPHFLKPTQQFQLNMAVSLAVRTTIAHYLNQPVFIKWSNDILVNGKKVSGTLIQNQLSGQQLQNSVIGIGINVNQERFASDLQHASSLSLLSGTSFSIDAIRTRLCQELEKYYLRLRRGEVQQLRQEYLSHLWRYQEWALYQLPNFLQPIHGKIIEVKDSGELVVEHQDHQAVYGFKEIGFVY
jgi:BirA family biotin operon repressor/biotin-[acetyl-CoA-carboxylase] ligase